MSALEIDKYPRTQHVEGSRAQPGDEGLEVVPLGTLRGGVLVVEEKLDGANAGMRLDEQGTLLLQSRGHYLTGGAREKHFALYKRWAASHSAALAALLGERYTLYGEWLYAKHTIYYDQLPHYFLEFDLLDRERSVFLDTDARHALLAATPVVSVPVIARVDLESRPLDAAALQALIGPSRYKSAAWRERLGYAAERSGVASERAQRETDPRDEMEGLYLKHERDGVVIGRYKLIRESFLQAVDQSGSHWLSRPIIENGLAEGVDIFAPPPSGTPPTPAPSEPS
ncbi:MAG: RNA ligase family protein [Myxococcales bacterium]|nr:RNA ligase family protein [Myxococcales bacterium]